MEGAVHVRNNPAAYQKRSLLRNCNASEPMREDTVPARHSRNRVPGEVDEVEDLPLDPTGAPAERKCEEEGGAEA